MFFFRRFRHNISDIWLSKRKKYDTTFFDRKILSVFFGKENGEFEIYERKLYNNRTSSAKATKI